MERNGLPYRASALPWRGSSAMWARGRMSAPLPSIVRGGEGRPYNRGVGLDAQINFNDYWTSYAFFARTFSPGLRGDTTTFRVQSGYDTNQMRLFGIYEEIGRNYNPEMGFVLRRDVRQYFGDAAYKWRPSAVAGTIREIRFEGFGEYYQDRTTGDLQTRTVATAISVDFANSASATIRPWRTETDVLTRPFRIRPGIVIPPGSYTFNRHGASFGTNRSRRIVFDAGGSWGSFYSGQRQEASAGLTWRPDSHLSLEASHGFNAVQLPQGDFSTSLFNGRVTYNFSRKWLSTCLVQVNSAARLTSINARVRYIYRPNSDIFFHLQPDDRRGCRASQSPVSDQSDLRLHPLSRAVMPTPAPLRAT